MRPNVRVRRDAVNLSGLGVIRIYRISVRWVSTLRWEKQRWVFGTIGGVNSNLHTVRQVKIEHIENAISILGADGIADEDIELKVAALVHDPMLARRLSD